MKELRKTTEGQSDSSLGLYFVKIITVNWFTLIRIAALAAAWALPMPSFFYRSILGYNEFMSLFVNMDGFCTAWITMCPLGDATVRTFGLPEYAAQVKRGIAQLGDDLSYLNKSWLFSGGQFYR